MRKRSLSELSSRLNGNERAGWRTRTHFAAVPQSQIFSLPLPQPPPRSQAETVSKPLIIFISKNTVNHSEYRICQTCALLEGKR